MHHVTHVSASRHTDERASWHTHEWHTPSCGHQQTRRDRAAQTPPAQRHTETRRKRGHARPQSSQQGHVLLKILKTQRHSDCL